MLRAASRLAARPALAPFGVRHLAVPVNQVARVMRMHVADEDAASKVDAIVAELEPKMKGQKGFVKVTRAVCKSEWAYEAALVFDNIDNFKAYMGSEFREKEAAHAEQIVHRDLKPENLLLLRKAAMHSVEFTRINTCGVISPPAADPGRESVHHQAD